MNLRFARNMPGTVFLAVCIGAFAAMGLPARSGSDDFPRGDAIVAEQYVIWAEQAIADGRMGQAQAALERANDFADVSSDVSYLLAFVRAENGESRFLVLQALEKAIAVNQWRRYDEAQARLLEAEQLIALRRFYAVLNSLDVYRTLASETIDSALLRLRALKGLALAGMDFPPTNMPTRPWDSFPPMFMPGANLPAALEFRNRMLETMDRNPHDPRPLILLFEYAGRRTPNEGDRALVEIALRRVPFLLDEAPELAWLAAPFIGDLEEARRLVMAYRAGSFASNPADFTPNPASIPLALNLGLLDDFDAVDEFFGPAASGSAMAQFDKGLIIAVGDLLRSSEGRDYFAERLHSLTGIIAIDENRDGIPESRAIFRDGTLHDFRHDADQDGTSDWFIRFNAGLPVFGEFAAMPDATLLQGPVSANGDVTWARIYWSRYPWVQRVVLREETFYFPPGNFSYSPISFVDIGASDMFQGLLVPVRDHLSQGLTRRALVMSASIIERNCLEFEGGAERVYMRQGMPELLVVTANGLRISVTEFENGFPVIQRVDLDRDGRMETIRRFHPGTHRLQSSSSDWDGDGVFEHVEVYQ